MIKNGIFNLIAQLLKLASAVLAMPLLIKLLGLNIFGLLSWSTAVLAAVQLAEGGLSSGLVYFLSEKNLFDKNEGSNVKRNEILTSGIVLLATSTALVIIVLFFTSSFLVNTLKNISLIQRHEVTMTLMLGAFLVGFRFIQSFFWAILQAQNLYKIYNAVSTAQVVLTNIGWVLCAYFTEKYLPDFIISSIIISILIISFLGLFSAKLISSFQWNWSRVRTSKMLKYNLGVLGSNIGSILFSQGDKLVVANTLGLDLLSVYTIFTSIVVQLNQFAAQAVHPLVPLVSSVSQNYSVKFGGIIDSVKQLFLLNIYISLGGAGLIIILAEPILAVFLAQNFSKEFILPFQILALIYGIYTISVTGYYIELSRGKSTKVMIISIIAGVSTLISMYLSTGLMVIVLSNAFFFIILILLFEGMRGIGLDIKQWGVMVVRPLISVIMFTIILMLLPSNITVHLILSSVFVVYMLVSFIAQYETKSREKKINKILYLLKLNKSQHIRNETQK